MMKIPRAQSGIGIGCLKLRSMRSLNPAAARNPICLIINNYEAFPWLLTFVQECKKPPQREGSTSGSTTSGR